MDIWQEPTTTSVTYWHIMFDQHEVIYSNGLPTESFCLGETIRDEMDVEARAEIEALFPDLAKVKDHPVTRPALPVLRSYEVAVAMAA